mmetsp:Transcript_36344/g.80882  ORF Transcript_36344/g.80882 Transcript_36344/m.80882 type:complete len:236 (+) Transcript_36344:1096-1803(+)
MQLRQPAQLSSMPKASDQPGTPSSSLGLPSSTTSSLSPSTAGLPASLLTGYCPGTCMRTSACMSACLPPGRTGHDCGGLMRITRPDAQPSGSAHAQPDLHQRLPRTAAGFPPTNPPVWLPDSVWSSHREHASTQPPTTASQSESAAAPAQKSKGAVKHDSSKFIAPAYHHTKKHYAVGTASACRHTAHGMQHARMRRQGATVPALGVSVSPRHVALDHCVVDDGPAVKFCWCCQF